MMLWLAVILGGILSYIFSLHYAKPTKLRSILRKQGISGPCPSFLLGNIAEIKRIRLQHQNTDPASISHLWPSSILPHLLHWFRLYGSTFVYSTGDIHFLCTIDLELVKEINLHRSLNLGKPSYLSRDHGPLLGNSIMSANGPLWSHQRKIIAPEFHIDKVKRMFGLMLDSTSSMVKSWESIIESNGGQAEIEVFQYMTGLSADMISRACFGSNYIKGQDIFFKLRTLQHAMSQRSVGIPGLRYLPTKTNREIWRLEKEINTLILGVVKERAALNNEKDLLQMILEGAKNEHFMVDDEFIVDNCKAIYFAGHETTAITSSWALMLLAANPDWQARARAEVVQVCKYMNPPNAQMLSNLKTLTMVIQETLRLYPPAIYVIREALEDVKFKNIAIPKGTGIQIPIPLLHQNRDIWGSDADQFNPERFANGVVGATKSPHAYMPFGVGSRICAGQHFAMAELKVILLLILSNFSFSLSPAYLHSPTLNLTMQPGKGVQLHVTKLCSSTGDSSNDECK